MRSTGIAGGFELAQVVRKRRLAVGLSQRGLADVAGLSVAAIRDIEQGRTRTPRPGCLALLSSALGVPESALRVPPVRPPARPADVQPYRPGQGRGAPGSADGGAAVTRIRLLGPLDVEVSGGQVQLGRETNRAIFGLLALAANQRVSRKLLIERVWPGQPPATANALVSTHVARLRGRLAAAGHARPPDLTIVFDRDGYRLCVPAGATDAARFRDLAARGRALSVVEPPDAHRLLHQALLLWRDDPLADVHLLRQEPELAALRAERISVAVDFAELSLRLGLTTVAVPILRDLATRNPLHEPLHACLMRCLAVLGEQAAAVDAYQTIRRRLRDDLGLSPDTHLQEVFRRILRQETAAPDAPPIPQPCGLVTPGAPPIPQPCGLVTPGCGWNSAGD